MEIHPSQRRVSCELCRKNKAKCQRVQPDDPKCVRCTLNNLICGAGEQRKVGRPKRREYASSSAVDKSRVTKRQRKPNSPEPVLPVAAVSKDWNELFAEALTASSNVDESFTRIATAKHIPSHPYTRTTDSGWATWPTFMTDRWYRDKIPGGAEGGIVTDAEFGFPPGGITARPPVPTMSSISCRNSYNRPTTTSSRANQALSEDPVAWINLEPTINLPFPSMYGLTRKNCPLPFGIGRPPAYYVHENKFSSDPSAVTTSNASIDSKNATVRLTRIVQGLRLRSAMVQTNRTHLSLNSLIHRQGPFFLESYSLCEYVMTATQDLEQIADSLIHTPRSNRNSDAQLSAPLISIITDIYSRILAFFQLFLEHLTDRAERQGDDPVIPIPGLTFNGVLLVGPCTQGVLFSSSTFYLLGRLEEVLGLNPMFRGTGLLSADQIEVLCDLLDRSEDLTRRKGIMRPADVRKLYARVAAVLGRLSADEY
ncbi:hypothetical protein Q7P36_005903 [Cladosporium allicinum]